MRRDRNGLRVLVVAAFASIAAAAASPASAEPDIYAKYLEAQARYTAHHSIEAERWAEYAEPAPSAPPVDETESGDDAGDTFEAYLEREGSARGEFLASEAEAWRDFVREEREAWERYVAEVEAKWQAFLGSTEREWVEYAADRESRSYVDFENGIGVLETLVPVDADGADAVAADRLARMMAEALRINSKVTGPVLEGQIVDQAAVEESAANPEKGETVTGADGVERRKFFIRFALVEDHLMRRAERYWETVYEYATEYHLDTALVMAIIETESSFNPRAKSWANAYGLMQIVPKFAGRESWREIYGEDGIPNAKYLFDPVNNIRHGACYLRILQGHYWRKVPKGPRRDHLVIASYNWGATAVRNLVRKVFGAPHEGDDQEVLRLLATRAPKETRDYLERVTTRRAKWVAE